MKNSFTIVKVKGEETSIVMQLPEEIKLYDLDKHFSGMTEEEVNKIYDCDILCFEKDNYIYFPIYSDPVLSEVSGLNPEGFYKVILSGIEDESEEIIREILEPGEESVEAYYQEIKDRYYESIREDYFDKQTKPKVKRK